MSRALVRKGGVGVDYTERLRRLAINDASLVEDGEDTVDVALDAIDLKTLALVRLAALVAMGGAVPSYGAGVDAAVDAGASADEIVDVLFGVLPVVGTPRAVEAAPDLALALGYDVEEGLEHQPSG